MTSILPARLPPQGVPFVAPIWINFGLAIDTSGGDAVLKGEVPNRNPPQTRGNTWCRYLSTSDKTSAYYNLHMGATNSANLTWSPSMHAPFDSEIVIHFDNADSGG